MGKIWGGAFAPWPQRRTATGGVQKIFDYLLLKWRILISGILMHLF